MILHEFLSFEFLRVAWWVLLGVLLIGFALTDGFDLGIGTMLPFIGRTDSERRVMINTIGPVWEGNQVWFVLGGGAIFAAWPLLYGVSFSGFYMAMFAILASLILRPVAFKYRSKRPGRLWRSSWDWALFIGSAGPALLFGVAVGNVIQGVPFHLTDDLRSVYEGSFWGLLNPFALLAGVVSLSMMVMHGAAWLTVKAEGAFVGRARIAGERAALIAIAAFLLAGLWLAFGIEGYRFAAPVAHDGPSNPRLTEVLRDGSWLAAYAARPWIAIAPVLGVLGALLAWRGFRSGRETGVILSSALSITGIISTVGLTMFPVILPSSSDPVSSLTVWDSSSSHMTLFVMLVSAVLFMPLIIAYTAWVYRVLWGKLKEEDVKEGGSAY